MADPVRLNLNLRPFTLLTGAGISLPETTRAGFSFGCGMVSVPAELHREIIAGVIAAGGPVNMEMTVSGAMLDLAAELKPARCTLMMKNDLREIDAVNHIPEVGNAVRELHAAGITACVRIAPELRQVEAVAEVGGDAVEFGTGRYSAASGREQRGELEKLLAASGNASSRGLPVGIGDDFDAGVLKIPGLNMIAGGNSLLRRAFTVGLERAVTEILHLLHVYNKNSTKEKK